MIANIFASDSKFIGEVANLNAFRDKELGKSEFLPELSFIFVTQCCDLGACVGMLPFAAFNISSIAYITLSCTNRRGPG